MTIACLTAVLKVTAVLKIVQLPDNRLRTCHRYKKGSRGTTHSFSQVFDGSTSQHAYFEATAGPLVRLVDSRSAWNLETL